MKAFVGFADGFFYGWFVDGGQTFQGPRHAQFAIVAAWARREGFQVEFTGAARAAIV